MTELGAKADLRHDRITVDGRPLSAAPLVYVLLHKPTGVVTTLADPEGRPTVRDLLPRVRQRVFPVGRLDFNSSGLVLLTNDGELAVRLMHPRYGVRKVYLAKVEGEPSPETVARLEQGIRLEGRRTAPAAVRVVRKQDDKTWLELVLTEGRKHEVRRMCLAVGHSVEKLRRIALGPLELGKLPPGAARDLTDHEVHKLRQSVGLA